MRREVSFPVQDQFVSISESGWFYKLCLVGLLIILLGSLFLRQFDLIFALLHLFVIGAVFIRKPLYGILLLLFLSATTGFFSRLALYYAGEPAPLDYIRASIEIAILFAGLHAFRSRVSIQNKLTRTIDYIVWAYFIISSLYAINILYAGPKITIWGWRWVCLPIILYFIGRSIDHVSLALRHTYQMMTLLLFLLSSYAVYQAAVGLPVFERIWFKQLPMAEQAASIIEGSMFIAGKPRLPSMTSGHVTFTMLAGFLFLAVFFTPRKAIRGIYRYVRFLALLMTISYLVLSLERSAIGMIIIGWAFAVAAVIYKRLGKISVIVLSIIVIFGVLIIGQIDINSIPWSKDTIALRRLLELVNPLKANTVQGRINYYWPRVLERFIDNPFGYGLGTFHTTRQNQLLGYGFFFPPHNLYMQIALETGIIGISLFIIFVWVYIRHLIRAIRHTGDTIFVIGSLAALASVIAIGFFNYPIEPPLSFFFWFTVGITTTYLSQLPEKAT